ncbi:MAG TPA: FtsX-like permease family protein [Pseudomonadales bacterium]
MDIRPILSTLARHKTAAGLIVLEIALSCAIISNAVFLISNRLDRMSQSSGLVENEILHVQLVGATRSGNVDAITLEDLAALRAVPGVKHAATVNQVPYLGSSWSTGVRLEQDQLHNTIESTVYLGSEDLLETMGLELIAGRDFRPEEYGDFEVLQKQGEQARIPGVIITRAVAERLFPDENPLGKSLYAWSDHPTPVVGVVERLIRPNDFGPETHREHAIVLPIRAPTLYGSNYLIRTDPERRDEVMEAALAALERVDPSRIMIEENTGTLEESRREFYQQDRAMAWLLVAVCVSLLIVTALGIVGLASFWVQQRTRQIGIRRALGATRAQILGYFQTENFLIASVGIVLGMALAFAINAALMDRYELPRLPWQYLPVGALALWLLGQLSVLGPALRAAAVPPAIATRSV